MLFDSTVRKELARSFGGDADGDPHHLHDQPGHPHAGPGGQRAASAAGRRAALHAARRSPPAHHPVAVAVHRRHPHARAHVPRERDGDLVLQRHRPGALHPPGAGDELAGAARDRPADAVRLALELPASTTSCARVRAARRRAARRAGPVPGLGRRPPRVLRREGAPSAAGGRRNVFIMHEAAARESVAVSQSGKIENDGDDRFLVLDSGHMEQNDKTRRAHARRVQELPRARRHRARAATSAPSPRAVDTADLLAAARRRLHGRAHLAPGPDPGRAPTCCSWASACRPPTRGAPATGACCSRCSAFVIYYNLLNLTQAWVGSGPRQHRRRARRCRTAAPSRSALGLIWWREHGHRVHPRRRKLPSPCCAGAPHEDRPQPALPRRRLWSVFFVTIFFIALFFFIDFVDEMSRVGRNGYTALPPPRYSLLLRARPRLRAVSDRRADRHHLLDGAAGAVVRVHDPAHRRPRARAAR